MSAESTSPGAYEVCHRSGDRGRGGDGPRTHVFDKSAECADEGKLAEEEIWPVDDNVSDTAWNVHPRRAFRCRSLWRRSGLGRTDTPEPNARHTGSTTSTHPTTRIVNATARYGDTSVHGCMRVLTHGRMNGKTPPQPEGPQSGGQRRMLPVQVGVQGNCAYRDRALTSLSGRTGAPHSTQAAGTFSAVRCGGS